MRLRFGLVACAWILGFGPAVAITLHKVPERQAQHSAEEVVKAFTSQDAELGATRSLCIGTDSECKLATSPKKAGHRFDLSIAFEYGSDELTGLAKDNLTELASALQDPSLSGRHFVLEGFTDAHGSTQYNFDLSRRRAEAVKRYLTQQGIPAESETRPRADDPFDPANRRVEARSRD